MVARGIGLFVLLFCLTTDITSADAPKKDLFLQCGPHLVAIGTNLKQKMENFAKDTGCDYISYDTRTLWQEKEIGGPIDMNSNGSACRDYFRLGDYIGGLEKYSFRLDRVSGKITWKEKRERNYGNPDGLFRNCDYYWAKRGTYDCVEKNKSQLNRIIENHNNNVRASRPKRRF